MDRDLNRTVATAVLKGSRVRLAAGAAMLAAAVSGMPAALRAEPPSTTEEATSRLERQKSELAAKETRKREIERDLDSIATERREITLRLMDMAALVQKSEEEMTAIETRLAGLERQERDIRTSLAREHGKISGILAALQRMGRNPPPVIVTRREDALQMVRSAMLLGVAFPGLRSEAEALTGKLTDLVSIMDSIHREGDSLRAERERLTTTQARLASLLETKKQTLAERQAELRQVREATADIAKNVTDLNELIAKLGRQVRAAPVHVAEPEPARERVVAVLPPTPAAIAPPEPAPDATAEGALHEAAVADPPERLISGGEQEVAMMTPEASEGPIRRSPSVVELAPAATALSPGKPDRITPAIPFQLAKGKLSLPARGRRALGFGDKTQYGGTSKGIVIETRFGARVTSPCDGWVVYAGEFRSYGQLLIINAGGGYHVLIAGMSQMDVGPGQFVLAAEPIGTMSGAPRTAELTAGRTGMSQGPQASAPVLYIEFRKDGEPINSNPWWISPHEKVQE